MPHRVLKSPKKVAPKFDHYCARWFKRSGAEIVDPSAFLHSEDELVGRFGAARAEVLLDDLNVIDRDLERLTLDTMEDDTFKALMASTPGHVGGLEGLTGTRTFLHMYP